MKTVAPLITERHSSAGAIAEMIAHNRRTGGPTQGWVNRRVWDRIAVL